MKSRAWITIVGTVWIFGFSQAMRKINHGMLPMPVFFKRKTGIALIVTDVHDTPGQWNGTKENYAN